MPKSVKKSTKKKTTKTVKKVKTAKKPKTTLVFKRSKPGRPKGTTKPAAKKKKTAAVTRKKPVKRAKKVLETQQTAEVTYKNGQELLIEQSKFNVGPQQNAHEFHSHNIPFDYGQNRVILLTVDPKFAFIYWEVQNEKMHEAIRSIGHDAKLTLRLTNLEINHTWDVSIYERIGNWYLKLDHPGQKLAVELGMKNGRGDFYSFARSNTVKMPRLGLAPKGPIKWMLVLPSGEKHITEVEEYTEEDLELLKKILGPYFFELMKKGKFQGILGSSAENVFMKLEEITPPSISS